MCKLYSKIEYNLYVTMDRLTVRYNVIFNKCNFLA